MGDLEVDECTSNITARSKIESTSETVYLINGKVCVRFSLLPAECKRYDSCELRRFNVITPLVPLLNSSGNTPVLSNSTKGLKI